MSGLNEQDARALTYLAMRVRSETHGAGPWDEVGTFAAMRKLEGRSLAMTVEHVIRHAADTKARNPGVLLGAYTPTAPVEPTKRGNPHRGEDCPKHPGQWPETCAGCKNERLGSEVAPAESLPKLVEVNPRLADRLRELAGDIAHVEDRPVSEVVDDLAQALDAPLRPEAGS